VVWIDTGTIFFDTDGKMYPCPLVTPMTFSKEELYDISLTDFNNESEFIDDDCFNNCYIFPICRNCYGDNYLVNKTFKSRNKSACRIQKLIALFSADLYAKRIVNNIKSPDENILYNTIEAIKKIKELYFPLFSDFFK